MSFSEKFKEPESFTDSGMSMDSGKKKWFKDKWTWIAIGFLTLSFFLTPLIAGYLLTGIAAVSFTAIVTITDGIVAGSIVNKRKKRLALPKSPDEKDLEKNLPIKELSISDYMKCVGNAAKDPKALLGLSGAFLTLVLMGALIAPLPFPVSAILLTFCIPVANKLLDSFCSRYKRQIYSMRGQQVDNDGIENKTLKEYCLELFHDLVNFKSFCENRLEALRRTLIKEDKDKTLFERLNWRRIGECLGFACLATFTSLHFDAIMPIVATIFEAGLFINFNNAFNENLKEVIKENSLKSNKQKIELKKEQVEKAQQQDKDQDMKIAVIQEKTNQFQSDKVIVDPERSNEKLDESEEVIQLKSADTEEIEIGEDGCYRKKAKKLIRRVKTTPLTGVSSRPIVPRGRSMSI